MCIMLCSNIIRSPRTFLSRSLVTPRHRCVIMHGAVNESLRLICHYQQNVSQHYYLLDTLVVKMTFNGGINQRTFRHYCLPQGGLAALFPAFYNLSDAGSSPDQNHCALFLDQSRFTFSHSGQ